MSDAVTLLEEKFQELAGTDQVCRKLQRSIEDEIAMIEDLTHRNAVEMARLRSSRDSLRTQLAIRHKWVKAKAANAVRLKLGISLIPGYVSPVDNLLKQRHARRASRAKAAAPVTANPSSHVPSSNHPPPQ